MKYDSLLRLYTRLKDGSAAESSALLEWIRREEHVPEGSGVASVRELPANNAASMEHVGK